VKDWLTNELAWMGFVMTAMIGGIIGYIKAYEQAGIETTTAHKVWSIVRRVIMAGFAGWMIWQLSQEYTISTAWGHIMSGIVGMFAAEFFEVLWVQVRQRLQSLTGSGK